MAVHGLNSASTLIECIGEKLPNLGPGTAYRSVGASGTVTARTNPPAVLISQDRHIWDLPANKILQAIANTPLAKKRITTTFPELGMDTETEVVNASLLYVMVPILEILHILYPNKFTFKAEYSAKVAKPTSGNKADGKKPIRKGKKAAAKEGSEENATVRFDMVFKVRESDGRLGDTIAILELKKREQILFSDFESAILEKSASEYDIQKRVQKTQVEEDLTATDLQRNGLMFTKQVSAYSLCQKCPYAALFNWDHLVLFNFNKLQAQQTIGDTAEITWINEAEHDDITVRKALLGWLVTAFEAQDLRFPGGQ